MTNQHNNIKRAIILVIIYFTKSNPCKKLEDLIQTEDISVRTTKNI